MLLSKAIRKKKLSTIADLAQVLDIDLPAELGLSARQWAKWVHNEKVYDALGYAQNHFMNDHHQLIDAQSISQKYGFRYSEHLTFETPQLIPWIIAYLRLLFRMNYFHPTCLWHAACHKDYLQAPTQTNSTVQFVNSEIGHGLFAVEPLTVGLVIGEYTGVINLRHLFSAKRETTYIMEYPIPMPPGFRWSIDAKGLGNFTRFINHSKKANCEISVAYDGFIFRLLVITKLEVKAGEQLTLDYGLDYWRQRGQTAN